MKKENGMKNILRGLSYIIGLLVLALGIILNTKTNLGVSPLISVSYFVSELAQINMGNVTFIWYMVFVLVEVVSHICTKRYKVIVTDVLQIPLSMVFTRFMNLFSAILPEVGENMGKRLLFLAVAIVLTGVGIALTLNARLVPNPGDGIVQALADCSGKKVSTMKNILDAASVLITIIISLIFGGKIIGVGIGTVLAVIFVGRVVAVCNRILLASQS